MTLGAACLLILAIRGANGDDPQPRLVVSAGQVALVPTAVVLDQEDVRTELTSGLTNGFLFQVQLSQEGGRHEAGARIDVRYEPWEEAFFVTVFCLGRPETHHKFDSASELRAWFNRERVPLWPATAERAPPSAHGRVVFQFLPFSEAEVDRARRWVADALRSQGSSPSGTSLPPTDPSAVRPTVRPRSSSIFDVFLSTSIRSRAVLKLSWQVVLESDGGDGKSGE
jgi:hypothetical protein